MNNMPILIPVKKNSDRCSNKNEVLLPITINYLKCEGYENIWIISDSQELLDIGIKYNCYTFLEHRLENQDELQSCWSFIKNLMIDFFVLCPVTSPFRTKGIIIELYEAITMQRTDFDFVTTYNTIPDRQQFVLNQKLENRVSFKFKYNNRKGSLSGNPLSIIDGAVYIIRKEFLESISQNQDINHSFWNGRFYCVQNTTPFLDIDTPNDLQKFNFILNQFSLYSKCQS